MFFRARLQIVALVVLGVFGSVLAAASIEPGHSDDHKQHCCGVCHFGHSAALEPAPCLQFHSPEVVATGRRNAPGRLRERAAWLAESASRAPPA